MTNLILRKVALLLLLSLFSNIYAESGYKLWLRYEKVENPDMQAYLSKLFSSVYDQSGLSPLREELSLALESMIGEEPQFTSTSEGAKLLIYSAEAKIKGTPKKILKELEKCGNEGYLIQSGKKGKVYIAANTKTGALYGVFHLLRMLQANEIPGEEVLISKPKISHRLLNHWDNLDRTVERGYAGFSIWDWHRLPGYIDQRYVDYARANASIGINGTVLTNVNANAWVLTPEYIEKVRALADVFRPYGIKVYLTARFSAPMEIGGLETADPLNEQVIKWWNDRVSEIYEAIPDFGGFLVKANSEGQPGPQNYGRTHAEGANMLADALAPYKGIVIWRAFVYSHESPEDRAKQANLEFEPLDGKFRPNVLIQVKNGAIDFQPREPFHPLFGAMDSTALALELQITQEYLGQGTSLAFLAPMYKECLDSRTYSPQKISTVASVINGSDYEQEISLIAGVSNIGNDLNWTGHPLSQANWYAFGRLAWDHDLSSEEIAEEWIRQSYGNDREVVDILSNMLLSSRETVVNYMTPLGLHHIMGRSHHYGPGPWVSGGRADWTSPYYHRADSEGIGFNRSASGSNAVAQYAKENEALFGKVESCPEKYLLWFHHLPWDYPLKSGNTLWDGICYHYDKGVKEARSMCGDWKKLEGKVDEQRFSQVSQLLDIQADEAAWWRSACLLYFQTFSDRPFPADIEQPEGSLEEYMEMQFPYAPGIKPSW